MEKRKVYVKYCLQCGEPIITAIRTTQDLCERCRKENSKMIRTALKNKTKKKKRTYETQSIYDFVAEVDRYNKKHGTQLSYGQYELKRFLGKI